MAVASSSACSASNSYSRCHDVFISHRGPDIKETFATALYCQLADRGVRAFLDKSEMQAGQNITSQLEDAIRDATVHVAIFTQNYAQSKWCLNELLLMVESAESGRATLLPVFHGVKPADLRRTDKDKYGPYAAALCELEKKPGYDSKTIQKWRKALSYVAEISGLELDAFKGGEFELLHKVVQSVVEMVPKPPLFVANHATGLQQKVEEFERLVRGGWQKDEQACKVVGIVGSGGVGKTTVAKQFFNANRSIYKGSSSFLFDVAKNALPSLQRKLIKDLKGIDIEIHSSVEGLGELERNLSNCKSIIVLDDIDHVDQLDSFLPIKNVLHHESLLLVTTRDKQVLRNADIEESFIYHLKELNTKHSRELFCSHAFPKPHPPPEFNDVVDGFLKTCGGLPLSLKVLGALLRGKNNISYWQGLLNGLGSILPEDIQKKLRVSYESLNEQEKQIFLDIACFCIGEESDKWIKVWSGSGWQGSVGLQTLQDKCLVELETGKEKIIRMHDLLVLMGRNIAQQRSLPIRIWCGTFRGIFDLLEQSLYETIEVRGIRMAPVSNIARDTDHAEESLELEELLNSKEMFRITKLQILEGEGDFVERMLKLKMRSRNLISLRWNDCRCSCLPSFSMKDLRVLEVNGRELGRLWEGEYRAPQQLLQLNIDAPLLEFPKSLGKLRHLEQIVVKSARLTRMPDPLCDLRDLQHIALVGCENLEMLPDSLGNLTNLRYLNLSLCKSLRVLPDSMEKLEKLEFINIDSCKKLEKLPHCLLNFPKIGCTRAIINKGNHSGLYIDLSGFPCLKMLPDSLRYMKCANRLDLYGCESLKSLPDFLGELIDLSYINLSMCKSLEMLPESFGNLKYLRTIDLSGCESLKRLPDSLGKLTSLSSINLRMCKSLEMLPESFGNLKFLRSIELGGCESLKRLPDGLGKLTSLVYIDLELCKSLEMLPDSFENLNDLYEIYLSGCESLKRLPDSLGKLTSLRYINLGLCKSMEMLPDSLENLNELRGINLSGCESLKRLPNSWANPQLRHLHLKGCSSLTMSTKTLGNLSRLVCLDLSGCPQVELLPPEVERVPFLNKLNLFDTNLKEFAFDVVSFKNLEVLRLGSPLLEVLPASLGYLTKLRQLWLHGCVQLQCLPDSIELLTELTELNIRKCGIQWLPPGIMKMNELRTLALHRCPLRELPFGKIEGEKGMLGLNVLQLSGIEICEVYFPKGVCPNLEHLSITFCNGLVEVRALPTTLISLDLKGCRAIMKAGGLCGLSNLKTLNLSGCDNLQTDALPGLQALISSNCTLLNTQLDTSNGKEEDALLEVFCNCF